MFIYFERERERARERVSGGGAEREGRAERMGDRMFQAGSALSVKSLRQGSNPQTVTSRPELKLDAQLTEPPRHPQNSNSLKRNL